MFEVGKCKLSPVPKLRAGTLLPELVATIAPGFINWNPATGSTEGLPGRFGWQGWRVRMQGPRVINENSKRIMESLDADGQLNPVLLWARWNRLFISYGGTRVLWAFKNKRELSALIVDYDNRFSMFRNVPYKDILKEFKVPPIGIVPMAFGWKLPECEDFIIADSREWDLVDTKDIKPVRRKRRTKAEMEAAKDAAD